MGDQTISASRKRMLLALYLDFILFMVLWGLMEHAISSQNGLPLWMALTAFAIVKALTHKLMGSPGMYMLSINKYRSVDRAIYDRESWLTILLGVLFVLEGTKLLVRWTQILVPEPFFGVVPEESVQIAINVSAGILFITAGYLFLKLNRAGLWLSIVLMLGVIASCLLSWSLWDETVAKLVVARRELQGVSVRDDEIQTMQAIMPEGIVVFALLILIAVVSTYRRFNMPNSRPEDAQKRRVG